MDEPQQHPSGRQSHNLGQPSETTPALPRWVKRFGAKLLGGILVLIFLLIAGKLVYNHFFPTEGDRPAAETGGGQYRETQYLPTSPYEAVRQIYDLVFRGDGAACIRLSETARQQFAANFGYPDCTQAVMGLSERVTNGFDYSYSIPSRGKSSESPLRISSCAFTVSGGPSLGAFTLTRVDKNQWLITDHHSEPDPCPVSNPKPQ